jgi:hypothetical protein
VKVLVVLEDPTLDQYIVKPIVEKMFDSLSQTAQVDVLTNPYMRGVKDVFDQIDGIVEDNPVDLFLIVIDRDCDRENHTEKLRIRVERHEETMVGCLAREEVEVWMLAAQNNLPASWGEIRRHCDPKEHFAEPWLAANGFTSADVGHGRKRAMQALPTNFKRVLSRCDELRELSAELRARLV